MTSPCGVRDRGRSGCPDLMGLLVGADQCSSPLGDTGLVSLVGSLRFGAPFCGPMVHITQCLGLRSMSEYLKSGYSFTSCVK